VVFSFENTSFYLHRTKKSQDFENMVFNVYLKISKIRFWITALLKKKEVACLGNHPVYMFVCTYVMYIPKKINMLHTLLKLTCF